MPPGRCHGLPTARRAHPGDDRVSGFGQHAGASRESCGGSRHAGPAARGRPVVTPEGALSPGRECSSDEPDPRADVGIVLVADHVLAAPGDLHAVRLPPLLARSSPESAKNSATSAIVNRSFTVLLQKLMPGMSNGCRKRRRRGGRAWSSRRRRGPRQRHPPPWAGCHRRSRRTYRPGGGEGEVKAAETVPTGLTALFRATRATASGLSSRGAFDPGAVDLTPRPGKSPRTRHRRSGP